MPHFKEPVQEEMVRPQSKVCFEDNRLVEVQKEEAVWNHEPGICSRHEEFIPERKSILEPEKETLVLEDLERTCSSFISCDEGPVSERIASSIQETEDVDSY